MATSNVTTGFSHYIVPLTFYIQEINDENSLKNLKIFPKCLVLLLCSIHNVLNRKMKIDQIIVKTPTA